MTEAAYEVGSFRRNLAVRWAGSGQNTVARNDLRDFGHEGSGFWSQGGGAVEDNVAAGHRDAASFFFTSGLTDESLGRRDFRGRVPSPGGWAGLRPTEVSSGQIGVEKGVRNLFRLLPQELAAELRRSARVAASGLVPSAALN